MSWIDANKDNNKACGDSWEQYALDFLIAKKLTLIDKNVHSRLGEIDLIMRDGQYIVFIEVKFRKNNRFGGAISAVSQAKQQKIRKTAEFFLQQQGLNTYNTASRFDVVAIEGNFNPKITWLKNAF